jgi:acylphosphatase
MARAADGIESPPVHELADGVVRRHVVVTGRVQGVFCRDSLRRRAQTRGVAGWACNRADGAVEAVFEGPETSVIDMVGYCREGPPGAEVRTMAATPEPPEGLSGFEIS